MNKKRTFISFILVITIFVTSMSAVFGAKLGGKWTANPTYNADNVASAYKTAATNAVSS